MMTKLLDPMFIALYLGSYVAKALIADSRNQVVLASRNPEPRKSLPNETWPYMDTDNSTQLTLVMYLLDSV